MNDKRESTPVYEPSQAPVHETLQTIATRAESASMSPKDGVDGGGEDARFKRLLEAHGLNKSQLAKRSGISASAVQKWEAAFKDGDMSEDMWASVADALSKVGIDPSELRPDYKPRSRGRVTELIRPLLAIQSQDILSLIHDILLLESSYDREILLKLVESQMGNR